MVELLRPEKGAHWNSDQFRNAAAQVGAGEPQVFGELFSARWTARPVAGVEVEVRRAIESPPVRR